ncbi:MAG: AraC family transcriptional regulator [Coriobacteriales bacterium]|nr:AraC family transcriptional regulator [Coriobacteriales bacterium]
MGRSDSFGSRMNVLEPMPGVRVALCGQTARAMTSVGRQSRGQGQGGFAASSADAPDDGRVLSLCAGGQHNGALLMHCRTGGCELLCQGLTMRLAPGELCRVHSKGLQAANVSLSLSGDFCGCFVCVGMSALSDDSRRLMGQLGVSMDALQEVLLDGPQVRQLKVGGMLEHALVQLYALEPDAGMGIVRLRVVELLGALSRQAGQGDHGVATRRPTKDELVRRAQEVMTRDLSEPLTIPATARLCGTSATVLKQAFREVLGLSVHDWYRGCRMRRAAELLDSTSYSVAQISSEVGYCNPSKFSKVFARYMGDTPGAWRAARRGR